MDVKYILIGLILLSLAVKIHPAISNDFPVNFDSIYHTRIGQTVADTGGIPAWDYVAGGRPHLYPPLYHLILGYSSTLSGIAIIDLIKFILPLVSALLVLTTFFLVSKFRDDKIAIWAAAIMAFNPIVTSQSYDSPHLFGLLILPVLAYYFLKRNYFAGGGLFALCILFNYGISMMIAAVIILFSIVQYLKGNKEPALYAFLIMILGVGLVSPLLLVSASRMGECFDPSTIVASVNEPGTSYLWMILPGLLIVGALILYPVMKKKGEYICFWRTAFVLSLAGFVASLFVPQLHPYDQLLLFGFSGTFLLADIKLKKKYKLAIMGLLIIATVFSVMAVKPALSTDDVIVANWIKDNADGVVLANLEVSGTINMLVRSERIETIFDQFLECVPNKQRWVNVNKAFLSSDPVESQNVLDSYDVKYVVISSMDVWHYGFDVSKFDSMEYDLIFISGQSKVYVRR